ncbi:MAG: DUF4886 domain-containing protein [Faecalibacterium sp.]|nr:DUF4886 domain-containing protein [Ruminococcus sp.]MCM1392165.1 DUF4886 domain-containing protein [Ruminococcus sp.]MCM1486031.1 DUF4886 domain-containing protein [Faecalibacterium sp.]
MKETNDKSVTIIIILLTLLIAVCGGFLIHDRPKTVDVNAVAEATDNASLSENITFTGESAVNTTAAISSDYYAESTAEDVSQTASEQSTAIEQADESEKTTSSSGHGYSLPIINPFSRASTTARENADASQSAPVSENDSTNKSTTVRESTTVKESTTASKTTASASHRNNDVFRILAIGNSFSEDATYFLHQICDSAGIDNEVINLYIQSCSLERHWHNIENKSRKYELQKNGKKTRRTVSIQDVLAENQFDVIVLQQASRDSGWLNTYEPFLGSIIDYLHKHSNAKIYLHETWAYEKDCDNKGFVRYSRNQKLMYDSLKFAYETSAKKYNLPLIKSGEVIQKIRALPRFQSGEKCITRDGYHMDYLYGRYAVALTWAKSILKIDVQSNAFVPNTKDSTSKKADMKIIGQIKQIVCNVN